MQFPFPISAGGVNVFLFFLNEFQSTVRSPQSTVRVAGKASVSGGFFAFFMSPGVTGRLSPVTFFGIRPAKCPIIFNAKAGIFNAKAQRCKGAKERNSWRLGVLALNSGGHSSACIRSIERQLDHFWQRRRWSGLTPAATIIFNAKAPRSNGAKE